MSHLLAESVEEMEQWMRALQDCTSRSRSHGSEEGQEKEEEDSEKYETLFCEIIIMG